jgi:NAD(P)-dependent dehydrogenase (short-subunit alcohol dehydrogenase family)
MGARFEGKVAVVTGAGNGMGAATARRLASEGARVVIAEIDEAAGARVAAEIAKSGGTAQAITTDVGDDASCKAMVDAAIARWGSVDVLVNNAALLGTKDLDVVANPPALWDRAYNINVLSVVRLSRLVVPQMIDRGGGAIVNLASLAALRGDTIRSAYGATKAAVAGLTRNIAASYARHNIRCNAVAPGAIGTDNVLARMGKDFEDALPTIPMHRIGRPEEVAALIAFLGSDEAPYITGQVITIDGGMGSLHPSH